MKFDSRRRVPCVVRGAAEQILESSIHARKRRATQSSAVGNAGACGYRFTTFERCEDPIEVIKSDGTKQPFDRNKLLVGLMRATSKRDIDVSRLNALIDDIELELRSRTLTNVTSHDIGDMVLKRLEKLDKVAYIRFASVYRDFKDIDEFNEELAKLR